MIVRLIDENSRLIAEYPIFLGVLNGRVTENDYAAKAMRQAVADKLVKKEDADNLKCVIRRDW